MAEEDDSQKTEDPTSKKLEDARKKGQVAVSKEVGNFMILFGGGLVMTMLGPTMAAGVRDLAFGFIEHPHMIDVTQAGVPGLFEDVILGMLWVMGIPFVLLVFFAVAGHIVQNGIVVAVDRIEPKPEKLNPLKGLKNLFFDEKPGRVRQECQQDHIGRCGPCTGDHARTGGCRTVSAAVPRSDA